MVKKKSYMSRLRSRTRSRKKNQKGGFNSKSLTKLKKKFINLKNDITLIFISKKALEKKYKDDPDKVIEMIKRRTKVKNTAMITTVILSVLVASAFEYKRFRNENAQAKKKSRAKYNKVRSDLEEKKKILLGEHKTLEEFKRARKIEEEEYEGRKEIKKKKKKSKKGRRVRWKSDSKIAEIKYFG
jgi:hypothetical protein